MIGELFFISKDGDLTAFYLEGMEDFQMKIGQMNLGKIFHKVI